MKIPVIDPIDREKLDAMRLSKVSYGDILRCIIGDNLVKEGDNDA